MMNHRWSYHHHHHHPPYLFFYFFVLCKDDIVDVVVHSSQDNGKAWQGKDCRVRLQKRAGGKSHECPTNNRTIPSKYAFYFGSFFFFFVSGAHTHTHTKNAIRQYWGTGGHCFFRGGYIIFRVCVCKGWIGQISCSENISTRNNCIRWAAIIFCWAFSNVEESGNRSRMNVVRTRVTSSMLMSNRIKGKRSVNFTWNFARKNANIDNCNYPLRKESFSLLPICVK